jgi:phage minor structural protein
MLTMYPYNLQPSDLPAALQTMGLGLLTKAVVRTCKRKVNGDWSLNISYPANTPEAALLTEETLIAYRGQLYRINRIDERNVLQGRMVTVEAPHLMYDLNKCAEIVNIETAEDTNYPDGITAQQAMMQLLDGTSFTVGTVDVPEKLDYLEVLQKPPLEPIKGQLLEKWGGELVPDNWTLHLRSQMGTNRLYRISHRRNTDDIRCIIDIEPVVTRLHVAGFEGTTFESINGGKDYIDSANIGQYAFPRHGWVTFDDIDDPAELLAKAQAYLPTVDKPKVTLEVKLANLKGSTQYALYKPLEQFDLGDTAVYNHPRYGDILLRMVEQEEDMYTGDNTRVVLGSPKDGVLSTISSAQDTTDTVSRLVTPSGYLRAEKLAGPIDMVRVNNLVAGIVNAVTAAFDDATIGQAFVQRLQGFVLDYVSGHFDELNVNWAEIETLQTILLEVVQQATINWAKIEGVDANSLLFRLGEGGKLYVDNLAVNEGNMVSLAVGQLMIAGPDGKFYQLQPDGSGGVALVEATVGADNLPDGSLPATKIIDGSITGQQINFTMLLGNEAMIGAIKSAHIDADEVWGSQAFFGKVTTNHLAASFGHDLNLESNQAIVARVKTADLDTWARYAGGILELGQAGSAFLARLGTQKLAFIVNGLEKASLGYDRMYIDRAEVGIHSVGRPITYEQHGYVDTEVKDGGIVATWRDA